MKPLGDGFPKAIAPGDPMMAIETSQLLARHEANPFKWDKEVEQLMAKNPNPEAFSEDQQSVMHQIPFEPGLRLEAGPNPRAQVVM